MGKVSFFGQAGRQMEHGNSLYINLQSRLTLTLRMFIFRLTVRVCFGRKKKALNSNKVFFRLCYVIEKDIRID